MCNLYRPPTREDIRQRWLPHMTSPPPEWSSRGPNQRAPFLRPNSNGKLELVEGRWGLVPNFHKAPLKEWTRSTNNARWEGAGRPEDGPAFRPTFAPSWSAGKRCLIPTEWFSEPNWETGRAVAWKFQAVDARPLSLAGLWNTWHGPDGELLETYTMIMINANTHPLMGRMHKPDVDRRGQILPLHLQDKRMAVVIEAANEDVWLRGSKQDAAALIRHWPAEIMHDEPMPVVVNGDRFTMDLF